MPPAPARTVPPLIDTEIPKPFIPSEATSFAVSFIFAGQPLDGSTYTYAALPDCAPTTTVFPSIATETAKSRLFLGVPSVVTNFAVWVMFAHPLDGSTNTYAAPFKSCRVNDGAPTTIVLPLTATE